jgi:hypothetical protein
MNDDSMNSSFYMQQASPVHSNAKSQSRFYAAGGNPRTVQSRGSGHPGNTNNRSRASMGNLEVDNSRLNISATKEDIDLIALASSQEGLTRGY